MEIDLDERLKVVRQNLATLQSQRDTGSQEVTRLNALILKYTGVIEYLESLKSETLEPPKTEGDGHEQGEEIPEESVAT